MMSDVRQKVAYLIWEYRKNNNQGGREKDDYENAEKFLHNWGSSYFRIGSEVLYLWCAIRFEKNWEVWSEKVKQYRERNKRW